MKWRRILIFSILITTLCLLPSMIVADGGPTANVTVTWSPFTGLLAIYITDYQVDLSWTMPPDAVTAMLRASNNAYPASYDDGYQVYYGSDTDTSDTAVNYYDYLGIVYYAIWFQDDEENWLPETYTAQVEGAAVADLVEQLTLFNTVYLPEILAFFALAGLVALAFWQNNILLYSVVGIAMLPYGLYRASGASQNYEWVIGMVIAIIGTFCVIRAVIIGFERTRRRT